MSNNKLEETEVKLYTPDLAAVESALASLGASQAKARVFERNVRYENPQQDLTPQGIVLRLRQDSQAKLTYKASKGVHNGITTRFEAEVVVSDFDTMDTLLKQLGFQPYMVYEKYRTTYTLGDAEIVLDEMPYGNFTEIEGTIETIEPLINQLNLDNTPRFVDSYTVIFDHVCANLGLGFHDLTFDNFAGVDVPHNALYSSSKNEARP
jgi:adenylate cyclase class 2